MKILVDKMPEEPSKCLFSNYDLDLYGYECLFKEDKTFSWDRICRLEITKVCPYLAEIKSEV